MIAFNVSSSTALGSHIHKQLLGLEIGRKMIVFIFDLDPPIDRFYFKDESESLVEHQSLT